MHKKRVFNIMTDSHAWVGGSLWTGTQYQHPATRKMAAFLSVIFCIVGKRPDGPSTIIYVNGLPVAERSPKLTVAIWTFPELTVVQLLVIMWAPAALLCTSRLWSVMQLQTLFLQCSICLKRGKNSHSNFCGKTQGGDFY